MLRFGPSCRRRPRSSPRRDRHPRRRHDQRRHQRGGTSVSATGDPIRDPEFAKKESATAPRGGCCGSVCASRARRGDKAGERGPFPLIFQSRSEPQRSEPQRGASERERPLALLRLGPSCRRRPRTSPRRDRHPRRRHDQRRRQRGGSSVSATGAPIRDPEFAKKESATALDAAAAAAAARSALRARVGVTKQVNAAISLIVRLEPIANMLETTKLSIATLSCNLTRSVGQVNRSKSRLPSSSCTICDGISSRSMAKPTSNTWASASAASFLLRLT